MDIMNIEDVSQIGVEDESETITVNLNDLAGGIVTNLQPEEKTEEYTVADPLEKCRWNLDMTAVTMALSETLNETFQELLEFEQYLCYETLFGVTLDKDTTYLFSLQGATGTQMTGIDGWKRKQLLNDKLRVSVEDTLISSCWKHLENVLSVQLEGMLSIRMDSEIILIQINRLSSTMPKEDVPTGDLFGNTRPSFMEQDEFDNVLNDEEPELEQEPEPESLSDTNFVKTESETQEIETKTVEHGEPQKTKEKLPLTCAICDEVFEDYDLLMKHKSVQHKKSLKRKKSHSLKRVKRNNFMCDLCGFICSNVKIFRQHLKSHNKVGNHKVGLFQCDKCDNTYQNEKTLRGHQYYKHPGENHRRKHTYICDICDAPFTNNKGYMQHRRDVHQCVDRPFQCPHCPKAYRYRNGLRQHKLIHEAESKPYECAVCSKRFRDRGYWKLHMRLHDDARPFQCEFCEKAFKTQHYLFNHRRVHTGEKPYVCQYCGRAFAFTGSMSSHKRTCKAR